MSPTRTEKPDQNYWRSLAELADSEEYRQHLTSEFPAEAEAASAGLPRRRFLQLMSASIAMAGVAGCRWPVEKIVPFASRPAGYVPGQAKRFATSLELTGVTAGLLVTSVDGRPIKIEGNPDFPFSLGATDLFAQASVLELYDPDRSRDVIRRGGNQATRATWDDFTSSVQATVAKLHRGEGLAFLCEATSSPSLYRLKETIRRRYPAAEWYTYEPILRDADRVGAELAFGTPYSTLYDFTQARIILDFDANLLQDHPTALHNTRFFTRGRQPDAESMNRLYVFEPSLTITGTMADHRFAMASQQVELTLHCLAAELFLKQGLPMPSEADALGWRTSLHRFLNHPQRPEVVTAVAEDLMQHRGQGLIVIGARQAYTPLAHILNVALGNVGRTVTYAAPFTNRGESVVSATGASGLSELTGTIGTGRVETLIILGGNPVYNAPVDLDFAQALAKVSTSVHLSLYEDETSAVCTWHLPRAHHLEEWGDCRAIDGTLCAIQPLIAPLYGGKTPCEVLSLLVDLPGQSSYEIVRETFHRLQGGRGQPPTESATFEASWRKFLHDGFSSSVRPDRVSPRLKPLAGTSRLHDPEQLGPENLELVFTSDSKVFDGRFANNAWLQELPDSVTKLTWDNAALISPATAAELEVVDGDVVTLNWRGNRLDLPIYIIPGQAKYSVAVALGYGRTLAGKVGNGTGFDTYGLRTSQAVWGGPGLQVVKTGRTYPLASTQDHHAIDLRGSNERESRAGRLVRETNLAVYEKHPEFAKHMGLHHPPLESLWQEKQYDKGHKWGMTIDLNACTGCNACIVACQSENNIPVVGKEQVIKGREMQWLRLDRYFVGDTEAPKVTQQPVACVQCEMAPCEAVCPVAATVHTDEGLNAMVYNRCVGTRYCSNNCPYKVRRFNFFNYQNNLSETQKMAYNPEVTARSRGVMEKCTYCVQRIEASKIKAKNERRPLQDGEIVPACGQVCPAEAIKFGDLNDDQSQVFVLSQDNRSYHTLAELNVKPRTAYLARIRNPNPALESDHDQPNFTTEHHTDGSDHSGESSPGHDSHGDDHDDGHSQEGHGA